MKSLVSVVIPVYNRERAIIRAIESVLAQDYTSFEIVVVDDKSTDQTKEAVASIKDSRVKYFQMPINGGPAAARNLGIQQSAGEYISFLDSDDLFAPTFLSKSVRCLEENSIAGFVWTGVSYKHKKGSDNFIWLPKEIESPYITFLSGLHIGIGAGITIRKEVFEQSGLFDEKLLAAEDTEFFFRISQKYGYAVVEDPLITIVKVGSDRVSNRTDKIADAYNKFIPVHLAEIEKRGWLRRKFFYKLTWLNYHAGNKSIARKYFAKLIKEGLFNKKAWAVLIIFELLPVKHAKKVHFKLSNVSL